MSSIAASALLIRSNLRVGDMFFPGIASVTLTSIDRRGAGNGVAQNSRVADDSVITGP